MNKKDYLELSKMFGEFDLVVICDALEAYLTHIGDADIRAYEKDHVNNLFDLFTAARRYSHIIGKVDKNDL